MNKLNPEFIEDVRQKAIHKWKWRNPYLVAFLAFLHPLGMLLSSIPTFFVYLVAWTVVWVYWPNRPFGTEVALAAIFAVFAYFNTIWKNAAIEKWKYGLPGTGKDNPKKASTLLISHAEKEKAEKFAEFEERGPFGNTMKALWLTSRGNQSGQQGQLESALRDFQEAIRLDPNLSAPYIGIATVYREKGMFLEALEILQHAPAIPMFEPEINTETAALYAQLGDRAKAAEYARRALMALEKPERKEAQQVAVQSGVMGSAEAAGDDEALRGRLRAFLVKLGTNTSS